MYQGTWDPEGILSTFPSIVTGITGMLAGSSLNYHFFTFFTSLGGAPEFVSMVYALIYVGINFMSAYIRNGCFKFIDVIETSNRNCLPGFNWVLIEEIVTLAF